MDQGIQEPGNITANRPIFATPNPLLIAGVREVLAAAGMPPDPRIVAPESLAQTLGQAGECLVILDGHALPDHETLAQLCRSHTRSLFIIWTALPTPELLKVALDCGVHGLLSTRLPLDEASDALLRICRGERVFRFDPAYGPIPSSRHLQLSPRERKVLVELAGGATNASIAAVLKTTPGTVKGCLSRLFRKTGTRGRRELAQLGQAMLRTSEQNRSAAGAAQASAWRLGAAAGRLPYNINP